MFRFKGLQNDLPHGTITVDYRADITGVGGLLACATSGVSLKPLGKCGGGVCSGDCGSCQILAPVEGHSTLLSGLSCIVVSYTGDGRRDASTLTMGGASSEG